jgi:hypothetical protein
MQEILAAERDKKRAGEVMLDGVEVLEMNEPSDLDDFSESQLVEDEDPVVHDKLHMVKRELTEIRDLLSGSV